MNCHSQNFGHLGLSFGLLHFEFKPLQTGLNNVITQQNAINVTPTFLDLPFHIQMGHVFFAAYLIADWKHI